VANGLGITAIGIDRLIQEPYNILMLDEPTNHLDAGQRGVETGVDPI
jgi:alpha-D-ribose 1-methylphosphonate 5-triphosphate synthase subunit PhnL